MLLCMLPHDFEEYIRQGEPEKKQRAENWSIAIGLQAVDGLKPSDYLVDTARKNIEGEISIDEVNARIDSYYQSKQGREEASLNEGIEEADKVSCNITKLLGEKSFVFSVASYANVHRRLFAGVLKHNGEFRQYNITKKEWVLDGDTVTYAPYEMLRETLEYDFQSERGFKYEKLPIEKQVLHIAQFVSGIWQIHAFAEGNTRTTAIFLIQYLRNMGYKINNEPFAANSWYFRNSLVRANYTNREKGIFSTTEYLERFLRNNLMGTKYELRNRYLHIQAAREIDPNCNIGIDNTTTTETTEQVTEQVRYLIKAITVEMSVKEIMNVLCLKHRPYFLEKYLYPAIQLGFVEMTQPDSPKSPTQKYRLTGKGRTVYNNL